MKKLSAFFLTFKLFSGLGPSWVYIDDGNIHYLFEKQGKRLYQGGVLIHSYVLPYSDSVVVGTAQVKHTYRGSILIKVTPAGSLLVLNKIKLEDAVKSIFTTIPVNNKNGELLKLKSIIARTLLLYLARTKGFIPDSTDFFVYRGRDGELSLGNFASKFTTGEILTKGDSVIIPFYHTNSGGITEDGTDVGCGFDYLVSVIDTFAKYGKSFAWKRVITKDSLFQLLGTKKLTPLELTSSGRVKSFHGDNDIIISADSVKKILSLPSLLIYIEEKPDTIFIYGRGKGSGLGISMESADYMMCHGFSYMEVVSFFYGDLVNITRRKRNEELYRIPVVQYSQKEGACTYH